MDQAGTTRRHRMIVEILAAFEHMSDTDKATVMAVARDLHADQRGGGKA